jgi:type I restriction enzyme R subunit
VQRLKTQLDQYTDLDDTQKAEIEQILPTEKLQGLRSSYLEIAKQLREVQQKEGDKAPEAVQQLDFEFVLFASAVIDYDYIMNLIAQSTQQKSAKEKMTQEQIINILCAQSNMMDEQETLTAYINSLDWNKGQDVQALRKGYEVFKAEQQNKELASIAEKYALPTADLQPFVQNIIDRKIFDAEKLTDLLAPLGLGWKDRRHKELALMEDLVPQLKKIAQEAEISGLKAYE